MILNVNQLTKNFRNVRAVKNISFDVNEGEIFAFLGPNGAGKTTTLRILLDIIKPDSGTITWQIKGSKTGLADPAFMGYLPEERGLYPDLPVLRTLVYLASIRGMNPKLARTEAMQWLEKLGLDKRANEKLQALSKGNQQKVQFVASILHKPRFAILDEPFSGFDPVNQELFIGFIKELQQNGTTVLLSAHQMQLVEKIASRVMLINKGEELFLGSLTQLYKRYSDRKTFEISLKSEIPLTQLTELDGAITADKSTHEKYHITFRPDMPVSAILSELASLKTISEVKSMTPSLHDIYVSLVGNESAVEPDNNYS
jgi:ABC-2 type transport system ATP-binding protein